MIGPLARPLAQPIAKSLLAGAGGGSSASLDIRASVGTSTVPTSTGTKAVTDVGFQPKCVLPFGLGCNANGAATYSVLGLGACTSSAQATVSVMSDHGLTTSVTRRRHTASAAIDHLNGTSPAITGAYSSLDADGFTLNWNPTVGTYILNHICLGGADLEVSLVQCQMNNTNAAQSFAHGLSGAPTGVLFFSAVNAAAPANTTTGLFFNIGAWAGSGQFNASCFSQSGVTTTATRRRLATNAVLTESEFATQRAMSVSTVDATNVNVTYPTTVSNFRQYFWMLAIRGAKCQVGTFDCNGSTSPLTITTTGITPKLFLPVFVQSGVSSSGTVSNDLIFSIGACDGTNNVSCGITDKNGVTTTNARRFQSSTSLSEYGPNGTLSFEGTAAFSGESVILTPTTASGGYGQAGYLILGS